MECNAKARECVRLGAQMRTAQTEYFKRISKAKKSRQPQDFDSAKLILEVSKELEKRFDEMIVEIERLEKAGL